MRGAQTASDNSEGPHVHLCFCVLEPFPRNILSRGRDLSLSPASLLSLVVWPQIAVRPHVHAPGPRSAPLPSHRGCELPQGPAVSPLAPGCRRPAPEGFGMAVGPPAFLVNILLLLLLLGASVVENLQLWKRFISNPLPETPPPPPHEQTPHLTSLQEL